MIGMKTIVDTLLFALALLSLFPWVFLFFEFLRG